MNPTFEAFRMHDEMGFPLTVAVAAAEANGTHVNLAAFACDAFNVNWTEEKVRRILEEACADNGIPFKWSDFYFRLAALWTASGKPPHPDGWKTMKAYIVDTPNRPIASV